MQEEFRSIAPEFVHLFDRDILAQECEKIGFKIEKADFIPKPDHPKALQNNKRENAGLIAIKV